MDYLRLFIFAFRTILYYVISAFFMLVVIAPIGNICCFFWSRQSITSWLTVAGTGLRKIFCFCVGVKVEYRGLENLVKGPCIIASKHQAAFEALMLFNNFYKDAVYVIKQEFGRAFFYLYPLFKRYEGIKIRRQDGAKALIKMEKDALKVLKEGRQFIIFPEGTRTTFGEKTVLKRGVERIYVKANVPVIPVALNTGAVMPRKSWIGYPGKIIISFLPPIVPGLEGIDFMKVLQEKINNETNSLVKETPCNYYLRKTNKC